MDLFSRERLLASISELVRRPDAPTLIYVTHHTEEIVPELGHALLLRRGQAFRSGPVSEVLTSNSLSEFFEAPVAVERHDGRVYVRAI
ncbi:hypothetical protein [Paenibacillus herberti]|uniref:ABC transporter ATP-binding protein n=1 Tax=Paenibacillus herberti TaxID=1619309 RepID=A0A229NXB1_9BACL|nr:hypothetical protein CGZ75_14970 [Paenibacillus herberti]